MANLNLELIKKIVKEFFEEIDFPTEIESLNFKDQTIFIDLRATEPKIFIGERGETLMGIQHLLRLIIKKKIDISENFYLDLDINNYKKKKIKYLRELATSLANEVALTKKEKILPPMPAYERKIIHLELAERPDVITESIGKEPERRIVISPYP